MKDNKKQLLQQQQQELLGTLKTRFEKNMSRHKDVDWNKVQAKLESNINKLWSLNEMEATGGEPDVIEHNKSTGEYIFTIVPQKALKAAEAFATTAKRLTAVKNTNLPTAL